MTLTNGLLLASAFLLLIGLQFVLAPMRAARRRVKQVRILGGIVLYLVWEPEEVIIILRRGRLLGNNEQDGRGGWRLIYPLFGDIVRDRVSLAIQSLTWNDEVYTREAVPCSLKVVVWWSVSDVSQYVFKISSAKHLNEGGEIEDLNVAEAWLKALTEASARLAVSEASFIEMLTPKQPEYLAVHRDGHLVDDIPPGVAKISANLAHILQQELAEKAEDYGLRVDRVEVQSIKFATEVQQQTLSTWLAYLKPVRARQEAEADRITKGGQAESYAKELSEIVNVLGLETTQFRELLQKLPRGSDITSDELLKAFISAFKGRTSSGTNLLSQGDKTDLSKTDHNS